MRFTVVDESLSTTTTRVLFQRKTTSLLQETTEEEIYTKSPNHVLALGNESWDENVKIYPYLGSLALGVKGGTPLN